MQKQYRLKRRASFNYVYKKGEKAASRHLLVLYAKSREGLKIGISVTKKVGNAVTRNRVKRLIREALNPLIGHINANYMYVIAVRPSIVELSFSEVLEEVEKAFSRAGKIQ